jgi:hypothetical protein
VRASQRQAYAIGARNAPLHRPDQCPNRSLLRPGREEISYPSRATDELVLLAWHLKEFKVCQM